MSQFELFTAPTPQALAQPDPGAVRTRVRMVLDAMRSAEIMPLTDKELRYWRIVMPQTTQWLPDEERGALCAEFEAQVARLTQRAA
jgi:hypothetical protein